MSILDNLWVEKYRPHTLNDVCIPDAYKQFFQNCINEKSIPNILLYGPPGSGKTTIAKILVNHIIGDEYSDCLILNGSSSNGIDVVRNQIECFLSSAPYGDSKVKIVFIDEADFLTQQSQSALRNVIEQYSETGRFIFTLNYHHKIIDALHSRFQSFQFKQIPQNDVLEFSKKILSLESIKYKEEDVNNIVIKYYPDVRKIINTLQQLCINGKLETDSNIQTVENDIKKYFMSFIDFVSNKNVNQALSILRQIESLLANNYELDYYSLYNDIFFSTNIPFWAKMEIGMSNSTFTQVPIPQMHFMTMLYKILNSGVKLLNIKIG